MVDSQVPYGRRTRTEPAVPEVDVLWITAGLSCDGDSISITAATQPSLEDVLLGAIPGLPKVNLHHPVLAYTTGEEFLKRFHEAARGKGNPFVLVIEGAIPNEKIKSEGFWAAFGTDQQTGQPIVCVPGCPVQPDNFMEVLLCLLNQVAGHAPMIPLDEMLRPRWLFSATVHEGCDRGGYYEQADFAEHYGEHNCIVKLGCRGPVVQCNVGKRGWMNGIGGCPNVGGICIGCTMPGFPDKFMPFMEEPPGAMLSTSAVVMYGRTVRALRGFTRASVNREPDWRHSRPELTTGYTPVSQASVEGSVDNS